MSIGEFSDSQMQRRLWILQKALESTCLSEALKLAYAAEDFVIGQQSEAADQTTRSTMWPMRKSHSADQRPHAGCAESGESYGKRDSATLPARRTTQSNLQKSVVGHVNVTGNSAYVLTIVSAMIADLGDDFRNPAGR